MKGLKTTRNSETSMQIFTQENREEGVGVWSVMRCRSCSGSCSRSRAEVKWHLEWSLCLTVSAAAKRLRRVELSELLLHVLQHLQRALI